jgi:uncharacterized protein YciU (UPF0263 family)
MYLYNQTKEEIEESLEVAKTLILNCLVKENLIKFEDANDWCEKHIVMIYNKPYFRKLLKGLLKKDKENIDDKNYMFIVKKIE